MDPMESFAKKQEILERLLSNDMLTFRDKGGEEYEKDFLISRDGLTVYKIANNKEKTIEKNFIKRKEKHYPSCLVIFDNRSDIQHIAIERNGAFKPDDLGEIIEYSLREELKYDCLDIDVRATYRKEEFWDICRKFEDLGGIEYANFTFPYPNLPKISDKVGEYFTDIAKKTNSEPTLTLHGQGKEGLILDEDNSWLQGAVEACAESGTPIKVKPRKGNVRTVGKKSSVTEELKDFKPEELKTGNLFDTPFQKIIEIMNIIKFTCDDKNN